MLSNDAFIYNVLIVNDKSTLKSSTMTISPAVGTEELSLFAISNSKSGDATLGFNDPPSCTHDCAPPRRERLLLNLAVSDFLILCITQNNTLPRLSEGVTEQVGERQDTNSCMGWNDMVHVWIEVRMI